MEKTVGTPRPSQVIGSTPTVTGTPALGQVLTCSPGQWTGRGITLTYQWLRDASTVIDGATNATYTLVAADQTHTVKCQVTATGDFGTRVAISPATATVT